MIAARRTFKKNFFSPLNEPSSSLSELHYDHNSSLLPEIMKRLSFLLSSVAALLLCGCASDRSISNSGFPGGRSAYAGNWFYQGELSEFDIIGRTAPDQITDARIQEELAKTDSVTVRRGDSLLAIQSGAAAPDEEFAAELGRYFAVSPFSGVPPKERTELARQLRLAAAQGGFKHVVCYWGVLESSRADYATKVVSWVPVAGQYVPDESQRMRIRLKAIVLDVASGRWTMVTPAPFEDQRSSNYFRREASDQNQVRRLKTQGYKALVDAILMRCSAT